MSTPDLAAPTLSALAMLGGCASAKHEMSATSTPPGNQVPAPLAPAGETVTNATTPPTRVAAPSKSPAVAAATSKAHPKRQGPPPRRVSLWNTVYRRRICGNSAPMEHNLAKYLARHPECEVYCGQDQGKEPAGKRVAQKHSVGVVSSKPTRAGPIQKRVTLWHKVQKRKVVGNAAPLEKNVHAYLAKHPEYEIYDAHGHEKEKDIQRAVEKVMTAVVTSVVALNRDLDEQNRPSVASRKRKTQKQVSGGKRPKVGDRSTDASAKKRRPPQEQEQEQEPLNAGLSFLLQIATDTAHDCPPAPAQTSNDKELAGGLLELLAQATASAALDAQSASKPESPPFSPMAQPTLNEGTKMEELSLAPSSVRASSVPSFHRLS